MHAKWIFVKCVNAKREQKLHELICDLNEPHRSLREEPDATHILSGIWLGNATAAHNFKFMQFQKINDIINVTPDIPNLFDSVQYYRFPIRDETMERNAALHALDVGADIIHKCVTKHRPVLIHCKRGHHRSATVIVYYLMKYRGLALADAIHLIKQKRPGSFRRLTRFLQFLIHA